MLNTNVCIAVWPWWLSHGAVHPAGNHHGWQADYELHSGDDLAVSSVYWLINVTRE